MKNKNWKLQPSVQMSPETAEQVAKIACALQSLSVYTTLAYEQDDAPADLKVIVEEGLEAMRKVFVW